MSIVDSILEKSGVRAGEFVERLSESNRITKNLITELKKLTKAVEELNKNIEVLKK